MPRTTDDPLDRYMRFRCTEAEGERLMRTARGRSLTFSEFARQQLLNARRGRTRRQFGESLPATADLVLPSNSDAKALAFQIQKVGVNLNQIVKAMHTHQTPPPPELHELLGEIRQYVRKAQRLPKTHVP